MNTPPVATSTIILGDFSFTLPAGFTGKGTVDVSNQGTEVHELNLFKLAPGQDGRTDAKAVRADAAGHAAAGRPAAVHRDHRHGRAHAGTERMART